MITAEDFQKVEMRVGRILAVDDFPGAHKPGYTLTVDFGPLGLRRSSAAVRPYSARHELEGATSCAC